MNDTLVIANLGTILGCVGLSIVWLKLRSKFEHKLLREIFELNAMLFIALAFTRAVNTVYRLSPHEMTLRLETWTQVALSFVVLVTLSWFAWRARSR